MMILWLVVLVKADTHKSMNKQIKNVLKKLDSARKLEKDILEKGLTCVNEHVKNVDDDWLDDWCEKRT